MAVVDWNGWVININGDHISHLRFAVDIVLFTETLEELTEMLNSRRVSLDINLDKIKVLFNEHAVVRLVNVDDFTLENVRE